MDYKRSDRVADLIRNEVADLLLRRVKDPRVSGVTITGVKVTDDLQHARIYYSVLGNPSEEDKSSVIKGLEKAKGFIRQELSRRIQLRTVPQLQFTYDKSFEYGDKIERLLKEIHKDD